MGLKAICMLLLFWWHSSIPSPSVDLGARTCEFLFVTSGFLVGYNYHDKNVSPTWKQSFKYVYKKLIEFWPLHIIAMFMVWIACITPMFTYRNLTNAILNVFLLQAWNPDTQVSFSFNGASWYLSALIFCYFISPLLLSISKKLRSSLILFLIVFVVRCLIEYTINLYPEYYSSINIHTSPLIRGMEYFLGMLLVPGYICIRNRFTLKIKFAVASVFEIISLALLIYLVICNNGIWLRGQYVILMCITVFVFSFDKGIISKFLSNRIFKWFSNIQFEFFILHQAVIKSCDSVYSMYILEPLLRNSVTFLTVILYAIIYRMILKKRLSGWMEKICSKCTRFLK